MGYTFIARVECGLVEAGAASDGFHIDKSTRPFKLFPIGKNLHSIHISHMFGSMPY